jgi:hypothetical protein
MVPPTGRRSATPIGTPPSALCSTDDRLWHVASSALCRGGDQPVSLTSPAFERLVLQLAAVTSPIGRGLYSEERRLVQEVFGHSIDITRVRIVEARIANAPTTLGSQIRIAPGFTFTSSADRGTLIHEMAHVWQYQTRGTSYISDSIYHQMSHALATGDRNAAYFNYRLGREKTIHDYPAEEQAQIIQDYYEISVRYKGSTNPPTWVQQRQPDLSIYEVLIQQVRQALPLPETAIYERSLMTLPGAGVAPPHPWDREGMRPIVPLLEYRFDFF